MSAEPVSQTPRDYVLMKRGYFWRPEDKGYTGNLYEAGRYTEAEAKARVNPHGKGPEYTSMHHLSEFKGVEGEKELRDRIAALTAKLERAERELTGAGKLTFTGKQLREVAALLSEGDDGDEEEVTIKRMAAWKDQESGEDQPAGFYAFYEERPDEGLYGPLGEEIKT